jgi:hypothetical protein
VSEIEKQRVLDLLTRLKILEAERPPPEEIAIRQIAHQAIVDEISRLVRRDWLSVYRNGDTLDVVSLA